ncbi:DUF305 domain-containing protein [Micromonospora aurantiaca (nom. illeg.)]|uniref:DUF305 domain-containing protein n=1 Tax=Micromonospora aurantiaca (nom. illeg.) TaxID=47850 RepID=UPI003DA3FE71
MAAAFLLTLIVGVAVGLLGPADATPSDSSAEAGFARDMATHHAQAVEMSMIAHARSGNPEVATLAQDIALTQQAQIGTMRAWLTTWKLSPTGRAPMAWMTRTDMPGMSHDASMPGMATPSELNDLRQATGQNLDVAFTRLMIRHHEGGIVMVDAVLAAEPRSEVRDLASQIRAGQDAELNALRDLLHRLAPDNASRGN